jgi:hypothetical protein
MWEDLCNNLSSHPVISIMVVLWPLIVAGALWLVGHWLKECPRGWVECLYLALSSYTGAGEPNPDPKPAWLRWGILLNGLFGIFALAYIIAILVVSLR